MTSNTKWESIVGYSRAVKFANFIHVSGTTATNKKGEITGKNDPYLQTVQIIKNIEKALKQAGASLKDIVRTRIYTTNIDQWKQIAKAHHEFFSDIKPATTMVEVKRLISSEMLVEMEAEAITTETRTF